MALFFDQSWFDAQLSRLHMRRLDLGAMLGLDEEQIAEVWKDQRELKAADVSLIAALLNVQPGEVSLRAGISTPVPKADGGHAIQDRLDAIEAKLDLVLTILARRG